MGIEALIKALPVTGIESQDLAHLIFQPDCEGKRIIFLEPPAGQRVPFVDPIEAMTVLFRVESMTAEAAYTRAVEEFALLRKELLLLEHPRLYHGDEVVNVPEYIPVPRLIAFLKDRALTSEQLLNFIAGAADETCATKVFHGRDYEKDTWRLDELPENPSPKQMIEFFTGTASNIAWAIAPEGPVDGQLPSTLLAWRESMMLVANELEHVLGEQVFHFQDLADDRDDDWCRRFFVLHCWCSLLPESTFVQYLIEVAGLPDVEALKAALLAPQSFMLHPFKFECEFVGAEATPCRFRYEKVGGLRS